MKTDIAIVYMVAGLSSRFGGRIKQFSKVGPNDETLIEYSLMQALSAGFAKIIFVVGEKTEKPFREMFGSSFKGIPILYALQTFDSNTRDRPWGTVDALCSAKSFLNCPFVVCNGDDIYGKSAFEILFKHFEKSSDEATIGYKLESVLPEEGSTNRGIFQIDNNDYITEIKEVFNIVKSDLGATNSKLSDLCSMNFFALHPETISLLDRRLKTFKKENSSDRKIECLLPNELSSLIKNNEIKMKLYPSVEKWLGITNPSDECLVKKMLKPS